MTVGETNIMGHPGVRRDRLRPGDIGPYFLLGVGCSHEYP